jgi:hypothetical protein
MATWQILTYLAADIDLLKFECSHGASATLKEEQMSKVLVVNSLTLDGVTQAPGRPDEDLRGGFEHGGWALPYNDAVMGRVMGQGMAQGGALLFGRRTYEDFAAVWPNRTDNPFTRPGPRPR